MKKIMISLVAICLLILNVSMHDSAIIKADTTTENKACPLPRTTTTDKDEAFISFIEEKENISRNDTNVFINYNANGTVTISELNSENNIEVFTSLTPEEAENIQSTGSTRGFLTLLWAGAVMLYNAYGAISTGCSVIEGVSGEDVCGYIGKEVIKSLVQSGTKKKFRVMRYIVKESCPYPPSSWQCNSAPFAYYKTELQAY